MHHAPSGLRAIYSNNFGAPSPVILGRYTFIEREISCLAPLLLEGRRPHKIMIPIARTLIALVAATGLLGTANAVPISGGISLAGGYNVNTGNLNTATAFTNFFGNFVTTTSGSFAIVAPGTPVTVNPFSFNPFGGSVTPLWSTAAGPAASFNLTTLSSVSQPGDNTLDLKGLGTLQLAGYDATPGMWVFTANQAGGTFSWSSSNASVPEGGTTAALLGLGLLLVSLMARRTHPV